MNRSPPHSLTVKYLGALSPIRLVCVLDRAGMTPSSWQHASHCVLYVLPLIIIFITTCTWTYVVCAVANK